MQWYERVRLWFIVSLFFVVCIGPLPVTVAQDAVLEDGELLTSEAPASPVSITVQRESLTTADNTLEIAIADKRCYLRVPPSSFPSDVESMTLNFAEYTANDDKITWGVEIRLETVDKLTQPISLGMPVLAEENVVMTMNPRGWSVVQGELEGEFLYVPVVESGIFSVTTSSNLPTSPLITCKSDSIQIENLTDGEIWYTLDGSDPRLSETAVLYEQPFSCAAGTVKAAQYKDGFWSEASSETIPNLAFQLTQPSTIIPVTFVYEVDQGNWQSARVLNQSEMEILPDEGGRIDLLGIASLDIPPDALLADRPVLVRVIALDLPPEVLQDRTALSPAVWVRFRGLSSPVFTLPLQLTIQPMDSMPECTGVYIWGTKPKESDDPQAAIHDQGVTITIQTGGRFLLTD